MDPSLTEITFHLPFQTNFGENLYVVGNLPEFGSWDPRNSRRMTYKHPSSWHLRAEVKVEGKPVDLRYKYCVMNDNEENGGIPRWEPGEEHTVTIGSGKAEQKDVWGLGKKVRQIALPGLPGKLYFSPMPYSNFDPFQSVYRELSAENIDIILLLCYHTEIIQQSGGQDIQKRYGKDGFAVIWYPIDDFGVPNDKTSFAQTLTRVHVLLKKGCNIAVQCHAGIGRTGLAVACLAKKFFGKGDQEAVAWVRENIIGALQTKEQVDFVTNFNTDKP
eukprot:Phypoly_transcript_12793.p1 GENE.Phypoly_transcript_12793~~Phypoly_transcript_12793.p1  ORF type:complete len:274 (+),score=32.28 Phypoly_transcript_12793:172-993(+)